MPLPQVNDRLKEVPAQALRTLFATVGQLLLAADRLRARAAEQLSGSGEAPAAPPSRRPAPSQQAPAKAPPAKAPPAKAAKQPAQDAGTARWRSLDKTGNVRLLDGDEEDLDTTSASAGTAAPATSSQVPPVSAAPAAPPAPEPSVPEPVIPVPRGADAAPAGYTPTEPVPAVPAGPVKPAVPAGPALPPAPAEEALPAPAAAEALPAAPAEPALPAGAAGEVLPVPNYDQLSVASLRARLRVLDATQVLALLDYEKAHEGRPAVITLFERRLAKLSDGS